MGVEKENSQPVREDSSSPDICSREDGQNGDTDNKRCNSGGSFEGGLDEINTSKSPSAESFNSDLHYLGSLCKREHYWNNTNGSLRAKKKGHCIECQRINNLDWRKNNPDKVKKNRDRFNQQEKIKEYKRQHHFRNREKYREASKKRYQENKAEHAAKTQAYYEAHKEIIAEYKMIGMILTYCYRIKPSAEQEATMRHTLELLRRHWNYCLGQRLDWLRRTRCQIDRCSIVSEPIGEIPAAVNYYTQQSDLKQTKVLFPDYKNIWSESQQVNLQRLNKAWERWLFPDKLGKRGGRPKFKKAGELRSFVYPRVNCPKAGAHLNNGVLKLSKIGEMPVIMHRPIPDGFTLKTCTIVHKADGWYCSISIQDEAVPEPMPLDEVKTAVGIDVGLKEFLTTSEGETVPVQQVYRKTQSHLARQQRKLARKQKGSSRANKQKNKIARIHQRIDRIRENFHYNIAHNLVKKYDLIAVEDLNIKGLARTRLSKSILDAAWGRFITILDAVAVKCGVRVVKVSPYGTSQNCSGCGVKVPKTLSIRLHECHKCGLEMDRDENAARNILDRALNEVGLILSAHGGLGDTQPVKCEALSGWDGVQLSLF